MVSEDRLSVIPFFRDFGPDDKQVISEVLTPKTFVQGTVLFSMGDDGKNMFFIEKGSVDVVLNLESNKRFVLTTIEEGDFFGEMALLEDSLRAASIVARENLELLSLYRMDFFDIIDRHPSTAYILFKKIGQSMSLRLRLLDEHFTFTKGTLKTLYTLKSNNEYQERYPDIAMARACELNLIELLKDHGEIKSYAAGDIIIKEGELRRELFVIKQGTAKVSKNLPDSGRILLAILGANSVFGEMSFLDREARSAEVRADSDMEIMAFTNEHLQELTRDNLSLINHFYLNILRRQCLNIRLTNKLYRNAKSDLIDLTTFETQ